MTSSKTCADDRLEAKVELPPPGFVARICQRILLSALKDLRLGHLQLRLQDGTVENLGTEPGSKYSAVIDVRSEEFWKKAVLFGHIGFSEAYMDGDWDTPDLKAVVQWFVLNIENSTVLEGSAQKKIAVNLFGKINRLIHLTRENNFSGSRRNIKEHYDLSNAFFELFLDPSMTYSSAKFQSPEESLEDAQIEKIDALCRKLKLKPEDHLLEIGSGWGAFSIHAARNYGCRVHTITISQAQFDYASKRIRESEVADKITIEICDYRDLKGQYDKVVSVEMIEAVGDKFMDTYAATISRVLKPQGLVAIQMITCPDSRYELLRDNVDFIQKYIFPGSLLPSVGRVVQAMNRTSDLSLFELEDMGLSYMRTLDEWYVRFNAKLAEVRELGFDDRFIRKWNYYLQYCSAAFSMRNVSVAQALFTRPNNLNLVD